MKQRDIAEMFDIIKEVYPDFEFTKRTIELWQDLLHFMRKEDFEKHLRTHIKESQFSPKPADIYNRWRGNMHEKSKDKRGE